MKRVLIVGAVVALALAGAATYYVASSLDSLIAQLIEHYGSEMTGVPVRVGSVELSLSEGRGSIRGLRVGNPAGYAAGDAFRLGEITIDLDIDSIGSTPIVLDELRVAAPEVQFETDALGKSNFDVIMANLDAYSSGGGGSADDAEASAETRLAIRRFRFEKGSVTADVSRLIPDAKPVQVRLPSVALDNLGGKRGATPAEIGKQVLVGFTASVVRVVASSQAQRLIEGKLKDEAGKAASGLLKKFLK